MVVANDPAAKARVGKARIPRIDYAKEATGR